MVIVLGKEVENWSHHSIKRSGRHVVIVICKKNEGEGGGRHMWRDYKSSHGREERRRKVVGSMERWQRRGAGNKKDNKEERAC